MRSGQALLNPDISSFTEPVPLPHLGLRLSLRGREGGKKRESHVSLGREGKRKKGERQAQVRNGHEITGGGAGERDRDSETERNSEET